MATFVRARVVAVQRERPGYQQVLIAREASSEPERAYVITEVTGRVAVGDDVLANTTAVDLGLGTGGFHVVATNLTVGPHATAGGGHIMKLRYTPLQIDTGATEEHLDNLPDRIDGSVVVACTLHSQVPLVVIGALAIEPTLRIAYVMTDGAALPIAFSELVVAMGERDLLRAGTVTAGHAFGGDREAVGVPGALAVARHDAGADLIVVGMGPGVVGTGHRLGTTALEAAPVLDTAIALGAEAFLCARASQADRRERHRGLSHHTATVLELVRSRVGVPLPAALLGEAARWADRHEIIEAPVLEVERLLGDSGLRVTTMGRGVDEDRLFFETAMGAGAIAAQAGAGARVSVQERR